MDATLAEAATHAQGCLATSAGDVTVHGAFLGTTGRFEMERAETAAGLVAAGTRECIEHEFVAAHVDPFANERFEAEQVVTPGAVAEAIPGVAAPHPSVEPVPIASSSSPVPASVAPPASPAPVVAEADRPIEGPVPARVFEDCYRTATRVSPGVAGRFQLSFAVTHDGAAQNVRATANPPPRPPFGAAMNCVQQHVRQFSFLPEAAGEYILHVAMEPGRSGVRVERMAVSTSGAPAATSTASAEPTPGPSVPAGPSASGDVQAFSTALGGRMAELRSCYQSQLAHQPSLALRLRVRATIEPTGNVSTASSTTVVSGGDSDAATEVAVCIERVVRTINFGSSSRTAPQSVVLPFVFESEAGGRAQPAAPIQTTGHIDPARTSQTVQANMPIIQRCYQAGLQSSPTLAGRVMVRFIVDPQGRVLQPTAQTTVSSGDPAALASVARCIEDTLASLPLPPPSGGAASVALPFEFGPSQ